MSNLYNHIRSSFVDYFQANDHKLVKSSSLIPDNDPSLLFTNAGMIQFKNLFLGEETRAYKRAISCQKCLRAGGKHNDLENVGFTTRHHTFFEMLGNFSFGDYFKEEAIFYAWEFLTKILSINPNKLYITIYHNDDEAYNIWNKLTGFNESRIIRISTDDNFWSMGNTGPCGPCTEIFYDYGDQFPGNLPGSGDEGQRFVEIWNIVFMEYSKHADGSTTKLKTPSIDTGIGIERLVSVLEGINDNYNISLFKSLINESKRLIPAKTEIDNIYAHKIIADHIRATSFLIADGVTPSNISSGYVLRRIMRRAIRQAYSAGSKQPVFYKMYDKLSEVMGDYYPELRQKSDFIRNIIQIEEEQFFETLERGIGLLEEEIKNNPSSDLSGEFAFKLYDTYGFPLDLTCDISKEHDIQVDVDGFNNEMEVQKKQSRNSWSGSGEEASQSIFFKLQKTLEPTIFLGYDEIQNHSKIISILNINYAEENHISDQFQEYIIITQSTCFYAESGGQVGDTGIISNGNTEFSVTNTQKSNDFYLHIGKLTKGQLSINDNVTCSINATKRRVIRATHSTAHLLHKALKEHLGNHIMQKGSAVSDGSLRFDFSHNKALTQKDIRKIEDIVNYHIRQNSEINTKISSKEEALENGATALFDEKYGDVVRVLSIGKDQNDQAYSVELCGGTHAKHTGEIGLFTIISEGSIANNIRRIEAYIGEKALQYLQNQQNHLYNISDTLSCPIYQTSDIVKNLVKQNKNLQKERSNLNQKLSLLDESPDHNISYIINNTQINIKIIDEVAEKDAQSIIFTLSEKLNSDVFLLFNKSNAKLNITIKTSKKCQNSNVNSKEILNKLLETSNGTGGGGNQHFAKGGGGSIEKLPLALSEIKVYFENTL